jgi:two-component system LytT family response regulator
MKVLDVIIVEDEIAVAKSIEALLSLNDNVNVVGIAHQIDDAEKMIKKLNPDLVLLDIKLSPTETGFDLLDRISSLKFKFIFITAFNDYALKAFKYNAVDYILKPIDPEDLDAAIERAGERLISENPTEQINSLVKFMNSNSFVQKKILFRTAEQIIAVDIDDIIRLESDANYTTVYLNTGKKITVSKSLKEYSDILEERGFFRVHQSHLINLNYFELFEKQDGGYIVLKDGTNIPVSKRKKQLLLNFLETF